MAVIVTTPINGRTDDLNELSFPAPKGKLTRAHPRSAPLGIPYVALVAACATSAYPHQFAGSRRAGWRSMSLPMRTKTLLMGHFPSVWGATSGQVGRASRLR